MPRVLLGSKNEPAIELKQSPEHIVVRTRSRRSLRSGPVPRAVAAEVADGQMVFALPEAGVEVYKLPTSQKPANTTTARSLEQRKQALRVDPDVQFAGGVLVDDAGEPVVYTENLFVKFEDRVDPDDCRDALTAEHLTIRQELDYATNAYFVSAAEGTGQRVFDIAERLLARPDVEYCHPELVRKKRARTIFAQQWHLKATTVAGYQINAHANVLAAHAITQGQGVTIAIIDDGVDIDHPEFKTSGKIVSPRDATFPETHAQAFNPRPKDVDRQYPENHGTSVAGVACAAGVDGASGVAPAAKLMPIRLAAGLGSQQEATAFKWAADHGADVISCSWGPADGAWWDETDPVHKQKVPMPASTRLAIDYAVTQGRGGKGCVVLFAAGNGNEAVENDGYASYEKVIAVAATNDRGTRSVYSDYGAAVFCAFPSNDLEWPGHNQAPLTPGIYTTDRTARKGYNVGTVADGDAAGNYTNAFGGTSSSAPGAAGVFALALAANPELTSAEVKDVVQRGCDHVDPQGGAYDASRRSRFYGYGRLNAAKIVALAMPTPSDGLVVTRNFNLPIPDLQTMEASLDVSEKARVARITVNVELTHTYIGDLRISLRPPQESGLPEVVLHNRKGGSTHDLKRVFDVNNTPELAKYQNALCVGRWTLRISDQAQQDTGTLTKFGLNLKLAAANDNADATVSAPQAAAGGARRG